MTITFKEYLLNEVMVDVDPEDAAGTMNATKKALRNPDRASKEALKNNVDDQRTVQQNKDDPNSNEKSRILKLKQQVMRNEERLKAKEKSAAMKAGV